MQFLQLPRSNSTIREDFALNCEKYQNCMLAKNGSGMNKGAKWVKQQKNYGTQDENENDGSNTSGTYKHTSCSENMQNGVRATKVISMCA